MTIHLRAAVIPAAALAAAACAQAMPAAAPAGRAVLVAATPFGRTLSLTRVEPLDAEIPAPVMEPGRARVTLGPGAYRVWVRVESAYACPTYVPSVCAAGCLDQVRLDARARRVYRVNGTAGTGGCWLWITDAASGRVVAGRRPSG